MPAHRHPLLVRQLKKYPEGDALKESPFLNAVNETYLSSDDERRLMERSLEISSQELMSKTSQMRAIFEAFPDIFLRIDLDGKILDYKSASINIAKILPQQLIGQRIQDILVLDFNTLMGSVLKRIEGTKDLITFEHAAEHEGRKFHFEARIKLLQADQAIIIIRDITERKVAEEQLKFDALHDRLTRLPNRALLLDRIASFIARKQRNTNYNFAVLFLDFDRFKLVNDSLGHWAGDELLIEISKRLSKGLRGVDTLARLGGDEFCAVLDDVKKEQDAIIVAERIQKLTNTPYLLEKKEIYMTVSAGIVISSAEDQRKAEDYIREADIAMYAAKKSGRAQYVIFTEAMKRQVIKSLDLEGDLRRAIDQRQFQLHYQPIISLQSKKIVRMEALVRWMHPEKGLVPPNDFISLAEDTGLIIALGEFVLQQACEDCMKWQKEGFTDIAVAVNFSPLQFHHSNVSDLISRVLNESGLAPKFLEVEITEGVVMKNQHYTVTTLQRLKDMKVKVSIDDFGTGYSSLGSLSEFSIDSLKVDRKFVSQIPGNKQQACLTAAIINLAHNLGLSVVGEGIETQDQLDFLLSVKCDEGQGYFIARPLPVEEALKILRQRNV